MYASERVFSGMEEGVFTQISNVARLPGVVDHVCVLPDGHFGYGFPIGGVGAFSLEEGVVSPGGVGYDINCGVRLLASSLQADEVLPKIKPLVDGLYENVPSGVGSESRLRVGLDELEDVCTMGAAWAVQEGMGDDADLARTEECGCIKDADFSKVGKRAKKRGRPQIGTLGSGNHFLEVQAVDEIYEPETAKAFGIESAGQVSVMVHCGSRGLGYQVADDYIRIMLEASRRQGISLPDKQLACARLGSKEADDYLGAMYCAVNYAFANRQCITHWVREAFEDVLGDGSLRQVYDVCHNIAKIEEHEGHGRLCVHRKGATRAFSAGRRELPAEYSDIGHPVIVPGDMGTSSYVLVGEDSAMSETFGSVCHGAGRVMSRARAKRSVKGEDVAEQLSMRGGYVRAKSMSVLAEEHSEAYKDIDEVVKSVVDAGLARLVARVKPLGVVKG